MYHGLFRINIGYIADYCQPIQLFYNIRTLIYDTIKNINILLGLLKLIKLNVIFVGYNYYISYRQI